MHRRTVASISSRCSEISSPQVMQAPKFPSSIRERAVAIRTSCIFRRRLAAADIAWACMASIRETRPTRAWSSSTGSAAAVPASRSASISERRVSSALRHAATLFTSDQTSTRKASSTATCKVVTRPLVWCAMPITATSSACCASVIPFARAAAVCECVQYSQEFATETAM